MIDNQQNKPLSYATTSRKRHSTETRRHNRETEQDSRAEMITVSAAPGTTDETPRGP